MSIEDDLLRDEGLKLKPYKDSVGKLTIGAGRNLDDVGISEDEAKAMLRADIKTAEAELDREFPWWRGRPEPVQRGLVNMMVNMGAARLRGFSRMLSALHAGDYDTASIEALDSDWARQVGSRAIRIANLFRSCIMVKNGTPQTPAAQV